MTPLQTQPAVSSCLATNTRPAAVQLPGASNGPEEKSSVSTRTTAKVTKYMNLAPRFAAPTTRPRVFTTAQPQLVPAVQAVVLPPRTLQPPSFEPSFIAPMSLLSLPTSFAATISGDDMIEMPVEQHQLKETAAILVMDVIHTLVGKSVPQNLWRRILSRRRKLQSRNHVVSRQQVQGIPNYGQTCFLNSVLQALSSMPSFLVYLQRHDSSSCSNDDDSILSKLLPLLLSVNACQGKVDPRRLLHEIGQSNTQFQSSEQQDAQEVLQTMVDMICEQVDYGAIPTSLSLSQFDEIELPDVKSFNFDSDDSAGDAQPLPSNKANEENALPNGDYLSETSHAKMLDDTTPHDKMLSSLSSISPSPLTGWMGSTVQCAQCRHIRPIQNAPFINLALVPTNVSQYLQGGTSKKSPSSRYPSCSVGECLDNFCAIERVNDVCCTNCTLLQEMQHWKEEVVMLQGAVNSVSNRNGNTTVLEQDLRLATGHSKLLQSLDPDEIDAIPPAHDCFEATVPLARGDAFKCLLLCRLPHILCLHIQRRYLALPTAQMLKTQQHVEIEEFIDFGKYNRTGLDSDSTAPVAMYRLASVIEHQGGSEGGHYVNFRRDPSNNLRWMFVSDEMVRPVDWKRVRSCQAYMLFYEAM